MKKKVLILGKGRIGKAVEYYIKKYSPALRVSFFPKENDIRSSNLLIGALPGDAGEISLKLALKYKKDLIDISDLDPPFYLKHKREIKKKRISVFAGFGFSPGIVNLICGREAKANKVKKIEILAGTLSPKKYFFPFLWSFEDLIEGHSSKATLIKKGKRLRVLSFSDYRREKIENITAESYFGEGLGSLTQSLKIKDMSYRVLRPLGFYQFFKYLEHHGFFEKGNINFTKKILEERREDNLTLARIEIKAQKKKILWKMKTFSKKRERFNSMQKITSIFPAILTKIIFENEFFKEGLFFPEKIGEDKKLFQKILKEIKKEVFITRFTKI